MRARVAISVVLIAAAALGLPNCKKSTPTTPDPVVNNNPPPAPPPAPLSLSVVAPYLAQTINNVVEQSLTQGLTKSGTGRWTYSCPAGGNVRIELADNYQVQTGQVVMLTDTGIIFTDCTTETNVTTLESRSFASRLLDLIITPVSAQSRARIVAKGRLRGKGKWRPPRMTSSGPEYRDAPVHLSGDLQVSQLNGGQPGPFIGDIRLECDVNGVVCQGPIGTVIIGPRDTPPPPNPTPPTPPPPTPPPPTSINVTGNWTVTEIGQSGAGTATLTQTGNTVTGSAVVPPVPGATITQNQFTGSVSGSTVSLTHAFATRVDAGGYTTTCTSTANYTLQASSNNRMSGPYGGTARCVHNIPEVPQPPSQNFSGSSTWTR